MTLPTIALQLHYRTAAAPSAPYYLTNVTTIPFLLSTSNCIERTCYTGSSAATLATVAAAPAKSLIHLINILKFK